MATAIQKIKGAKSGGLLKTAKKASLELQIAALCYRKTDKTHEILLVKSSNGNWILPKGWPIAEKSPAETAAIEAFEEAGVIGKIKSRAIGQYRYTKQTETGREIHCIAEAYPMEVRKQVQDFPERKSRETLWLKPGKAAKRVEIAELRDLILNFQP